MVEPILQLSLKKDSKGNQFIHWLYRKYRNEEPPAMLNLCNAFWGVVVWGTIVLTARFLSRPFDVLADYLHRRLSIESYEAICARLERKKERRARHKRRMKAVAQFFWTLLWPLRFLGLRLVRLVAYAVVPTVSWCRKHDDLLDAIFLSMLVFCVAGGLVWMSVLAALDLGWWGGFLPIGVILVAGTVAALLVFAAKHKYFRFLKPVGRFLLLLVKLPWQLLKGIWIILVAVKYRLCPLVRVE